MSNKTANQQYRIDKAIAAFSSVKDRPEVFEDIISGDIGKGWIPIVNELITKLLEIYPDIRILQIKEKFGYLRFYYDSVPKELEHQIASLVSAAEKAASTTCEACGSDENVSKYGGGWVKTLCDKCGARRNVGDRTIWE